jgi:hypothetical protein
MTGTETAATSGAPADLTPEGEPSAYELLLEQEREATAFERARAEVAETELAALEYRISAVIDATVDAAVTVERARADAAEAEASRLRDLLAEQERAAGMDAEYMAPRDAARVLRVDPTTLVTFESAGKLTTVRTPWGHRRYRTEDVKALRREREARRG